MCECFLTIMLVCFYTCIVSNHCSAVVVGKIAIMADIDFVTYFKINFNKTFYVLCLILIHQPISWSGSTVYYFKCINSK